jgi:hypothetical protein
MDPSTDNPHELTCTYRELPNDLKPGEAVLFAHGTGTHPFRGPRPLRHHGPAALPPRHPPRGAGGAFLLAALRHGVTAPAFSARLASVLAMR